VRDLEREKGEREREEKRAETEESGTKLKDERNQTSTTPDNHKRVEESNSKQKRAGRAESRLDFQRIDQKQFQKAKRGKRSPDRERKRDQSRIERGREPRSIDHKASQETHKGRQGEQKRAELDF
jgi:hypothetical protein